MSDSLNTVSALKLHNSVYFETQQFRKVIDLLPDAMFVVDNDGKVTAWNQAMVHLTGINREDIIGKSNQAYALAIYGDKKTTLIDYVLNDIAEIDNRFDHFSRKNTSLTAEDWLPKLQNGLGGVAWLSAAALYNEKNQFYGAIQTIRDISGKKNTERRLKRVNRALNTLSDVNQSLVHAKGEQELLQSIVNTIVHSNGYRLAWVGYLDKNAENNLRIVSHAGYAEGKAGVRVVCHNKTYGCSSVASALVDMKPYITRNIMARNQCNKCWGDATEREYTSTVTLPLVHENNKIGVIAIYAKDEDAFDDEEIALLQKLADDLAYGIVHIRTTQDRDKAVQELKIAHDQLEHKVAERTKELMQANEQLKELDRLKSMFIASMSHELRTPLNSIIGFSGIMLKELPGEVNDKQKEHLERIYGSGKHLLELVSNVIDIAKIEGDRIDIYPQYFKLDELVTDIIASYAPQAEKKKLPLEVNIEDDIILFTDRKRLQQAVSNLLSNAIKYTESGVIKLTAHNYYGMVEIVVTDSGIGIPKEQLPKLFEAFERLDTHLKIKAGGTGLGLYLTDKLVTEILKGEIEVQSEPGKGSTFRIRIARDLKDH